MTTSDLRVALVAPDGTGGGIENYSDRFAASLEDVGISVHRVPIRHPQTANPRRFASVFSAVPDDVDLVHLQYEAALFGRLLVSGVWTPLVVSLRDTPIVTTIHEVHDAWPDHSAAGSTLLRLRDRVLEGILLDVSDRVIVHTEHATDILHSRHPRTDHVVTLRHPVDTPVADPVGRAEARERLDVSGDLVVTTLGWIEPKKRFGDVVDVLPDLPGANYLIAGKPRTDADESVLRALFERAERLGVRDRVRHLGYVPDEDLPTLFGATDVAVLPYTTVTQSGALNTALGYRCPVVATNHPTFQELTDDYDCVETYDRPEELAATLAAYRDPSVRETAARSANRYAEVESWKSVAASTIELYQNVLGPKHY